MPQIGWKCVLDNAKVSFGECIDCARQISPRGRCDFTPEILLGMRPQRQATPEYRLKTRTLSLSSLIGEERQQVLKLFVDYYAPVASSFFAFRGNMGHAIVDAQTRSDAWHEVPYLRELPHKIDNEVWRVSARADVIIPYAPITILDYKSCKAVPRFDKPYGNHPHQLNGYRWIFEPFFLAEKLRVLYFDMAKPRRLDVEIEDVNEVGERLYETAVTIVHSIKATLEAREKNPDALVLPDAELNPRKFPCSYCDVIGVCKELKTNDKPNGGK